MCILLVCGESSKETPTESKRSPVFPLNNLENFCRKQVFFFFFKKKFFIKYHWQRWLRYSMWKIFRFNYLTFKINLIEINWNLALKIRPYMYVADEKNTWKYWFFLNSFKIFSASIFKIYFMCFYKTFLNYFLLIYLFAFKKFVCFSFLLNFILI